MRIHGLFLPLLLLSAVSTENLFAQAQWGVGSVGRGKAIAAGVAIAGVAGVGVTYLILHNRGVATGCVTGVGGNQIFTTGSKQSYSLIETGPALTPGERYKVKGRASGPSSARTFTVDKLVKDLGRCP